jgi:hypothetical protein
MKILQKNSQHSSNIYVVLEFDKHGELESLNKSSSVDSGIKSIKKEYEGLIWYNSLNQNSYLKVNKSLFSSSYASLNISKIDGLPVNNNYFYSNNIDAIERCITHYEEVWGSFVKKYPGRKFYPIHGDLSLVGNVLFNEAGIPTFIDWEHFHISGAPIGFDLLYLFLDCLWNEYINKSRFSHDSISHLKISIQRLKENMLLSPYFSDHTFIKLVSFINNNQGIWGEQCLKISFLNSSSQMLKELADI